MRIANQSHLRADLERSRLGPRAVGGRGVGGGARDDDLGSHHARANLRRAVDAGLAALERLQQRKGALGHGDVAKAFGDHDGESDFLGTRNGDAEVVAEDRLQIGIVDSTRDDRGHACGLRGLDGDSGDARAADHHAALHVGLDLRCVKDRIGRGAGHADRADGFTADAEDSLHEHRVGFDDRAFAGKYLDHRAIDVRLGFNGELRAPKHHLPRGGADALDGARGRRCDFLLAEAEDALRPRDDLTRRNLVADLHQQQIGKIGGLH